MPTRIWTVQDSLLGMEHILDTQTVECKENNAAESLKRVNGIPKLSLKCSNTTTMRANCLLCSHQPQQSR